MSGFAVIYDRSNAPVETGVLERVMQRLEHRGPDGKHTSVSGPIAMGHWHFWTTPEEVGEHQPVRLPGTPYTIVLDGRLDNRTDVVNRLNLSVGEGNELSDALLILQAYEHWGTGCFKDLIGEYAFVIWDDRHKELICARDAVGDRTLFYTVEGTQVIIASEPFAVTAGMKRQVEIDERAVAHHFAMWTPDDGQTFFRDVYELLPAHWMKLNADSQYQEQYWQPSIEKRHHRRSDADYIEEFRDLLETSVRCRLRSSTPPGVMLSGGLDSSSIACLAAGMFAPAPLTTFSYVFDEFPECDERRYINTVRDLYATRSIQIPCDDLWPFKTWPSWPLNPNWPPANPYRLILERTYGKAREEGFRVLLTGMYGDNLYARSNEWLIDLLLNKRTRQFAGELNYMITKYGLPKVIRSGILTSTIKHMALKISWLQGLKRKSPPTDWLTPYSLRLLKQKSKNKRFSEQNALLNWRDAAGNTQEIPNVSRYNLELRTPYHDRRLIEFVMGLPAYMLFSRGITRSILRKAVEGVLPGLINQRSDKTNLHSFYQFGVQNRKSEIESDLTASDASWREYVIPEVVIDEWRKTVGKKNGSERTLLPMLSIFYNLWYKSVFNAG